MMLHANKINEMMVNSNLCIANIYLSFIKYMRE